MGAGNGIRRLLAGLALAGAPLPAPAGIAVPVTLEPTRRKDGLMISRHGLESGLAALPGEPVRVVMSLDLTDSMRATRSGGFQVFVAPPQVVASALAHGYERLGSTEPVEEYVPAGRPRLSRAADMRSGRICLPQQDSISTDLARGMLTAHGLSFRDRGRVQHQRHPQAGLTAVRLGRSEATVIRKRDRDKLPLAEAGRARVLAASGPVPGGFGVAVSQALPAEARARLARWFATPAASCGTKIVAGHCGRSDCERVAQLGTFTPAALPGARVVGAADVQRLLAEGVQLAGTRAEQECRAKRLPGAVFVPYVEKSPRGVACDAALDDFAALRRLDPARPAVFHCNGAECWRSWEASKAAPGAGFAAVYRFRGGLPEWERAGLPLGPPAAAERAGS